MDKKLSEQLVTAAKDWIGAHYRLWNNNYREVPYQAQGQTKREIDQAENQFQLLLRAVESIDVYKEALETACRDLYNERLFRYYKDLDRTAIKDPIPTSELYLSQAKLSLKTEEKSTHSEDM